MELAPIFLEYLPSLRGEPWFEATMMILTALVVMSTGLLILSRIVMNAVSNIKNIRNDIAAITPKPKQLKALAIAEETASSELDNLAKDYGADRAAIMLFHNGKVSIGGIHLLSASIKAEGSSGRFPRISSKVQSVPMSVYGRWTKMLISGVDVTLPDVSLVAHQEAPDIAIQLEQNSVKSLYAFPVVANNGDIDGCMFIEYCLEKRTLGEVEKSAIRARGQSIYTKLHEVDYV